MAVFPIWAIAIHACLSSAPSLAAPLSSSATKAEEKDIYFDARQTTYDQKAMVQHFTGEVVAITAHLLIAADTLTLDRSQQHLTADGHVIIASQSQIITGEHLNVNLKTREFAIDNAKVVNYEKEKNQEVIAKILGFTPGENQFNLSQKHQLEVLSAHKGKLTRDYLSAPTHGSSRHDVIDQFALLLKQEEQITQQKFLDVLPLNAQKKSILQQRRDFWQQQQEEKSRISTHGIGYFRLQGDQIRQIEHQHLLAEHGIFTPCQCQEDSSPAWGFRASRIDAQMGGYADLDNSVLEIQGVPVLYLPFMRFPLKSQRQTGFLFPDISYHSRDGNIINSPLYIDINPWSDSTITTTFIERRGWRLGVEYRSQYKNYSGWQINGEGLRDQLWLSDVAAHSTFRSRYRTANPNLGDTDPTLDYLTPPSNTWRGKTSWSGLSILSDSVSVVSEGSVASDHRYDNDFSYRYFVDSPSRLRPPFAKAGAMLNIDEESFQSSLSSRLADHSLNKTPFSGIQEPLHLTYQSKFFQLSPARRNFPLYAQIAAQHYNFHLIKEKSPPGNPASNIFAHTLNNAQWFGSQFKAYAPINRDQAVQVSFFSEFDARMILAQPPVVPDLAFPSGFTQNDSSEPSSLHSLRSGLSFRVPLNGFRLLSKEVKPGAVDGATTFRTFNHDMNWEVVLSLRPYVVRRGNYGDQFKLNTYDETTQKWQSVQQSEPLTYLASDSKYLLDSPLIPEEFVMVPHQKIIFKTNHHWCLREKQLSEIPRKEQLAADDSATKEAVLTPSPHALGWQERAKKELEAALTNNQARRVDEEAYLASRPLPDLLKNMRTQNELLPLSWGSQISYDYQKEKERSRQISLLEDFGVYGRLAEPWSTWTNQLSLNWWEWDLGYTGEYNIYQKVTTQTGLTLAAPTIAHLKLSLLYKIEKEYIELGSGDFTHFPRYTREVSLASDLIDYLPLLIRYGETSRFPPAGEKTLEKMAAIGVSYFSSSRCWGLKTSWEKSYAEKDWHGTYYLGLVVNFFNTNRNLGNLVSRYNGLEKD